MASTKVFNSKTGLWEVTGTSQAAELALIDIEGNFKRNNVEEAIRILANTGKTNTAQIDGVKGSVQSIDAILDEHITNHPGGSGGGNGSGSGCTITSTFTDGVVDNDVDLYIPVFFTPSIGAVRGTAYIMINDIEIGSQMIERGNVRIHIGILPAIKNTIGIYVRDNKGAMSSLLTFNVVKGGIEFDLQFDYNVDYSIDDVIRAPYTITTPLEENLTLEIYINSVKKEVPIKNTGAGEYTFTGLTIGVHTVRMIVTSGIYRSKEYKFNLVVVSSYNLYVSTTFVGGSFEAGVPIIFDYRVSKLSSENFNVKLLLNNVVQKELISPSGSYTWTLSYLDVGKHTLKVEARSTSGEYASTSVEITVYAGEYTPIKQVEAGLLACFNANSMTNQDTTKEKWIDESGNGVVATLKNFNFKTNGWITSNLPNGKTEKVLRCDNEAYVEIDMTPYKDNIKLGSTIDIVYRTKNIGYEEARVLDYTDIETPNKGIYINVVESVFKSATNTGKVFLDEDAEIRLTFVVDRTNKFGLIYINGVLSRPFYLSDSGGGVNKFYEDFSHTQKIYLNSEKGIKNFGASDIRRLRVYSRALTSDEIIQNHLSDIEDIVVQRDRYKFNFENKTTPVIKMYAPEKDLANMTEFVSVPCRVKYESPNEDFFGKSFDLPQCDVTFQGTSSLQYVLKNYTLRLKDENLKPYMYTPYKNGIEENVYCLKAD